MKSSILAIAACVLSLAGHATAQTATVIGLKPIQTLDCYKASGNLTKKAEYDFASDGWCQQLCGGDNLPVMALTAGSICWCGDTIPGADQKVSKSYCNSPCNGFNETTCGGFGYWQMYLVGLTNDVKVAPNSSTSAGSSPSSTKAAETIVVTSGASSGSGANKVGIAVGIIVGLVVVSGIAGGFIFFLKQRKKKAIEDEHRRLEAQAAALAAEKSDASSIRTDQRLDPSNIHSHRRESIGSIADEMDFSRRILQVRNPDRFSSSSGAP